MAMSNRATAMQYRFCEISVGDLISEYRAAWLENKTNYSNEFLDINQTGIERLFWLLENKTTEKQSSTIKMLRAGMTEPEIAKARGINQSTVQKLKYGTKGKYGGVGGIKRKVITLIKYDLPMRDIVNALHRMIINDTHIQPHS